MEQESASEFYARLARNAAGETDIDLEKIIRADRMPQEGTDL
jgi:hypothetical protein